MAETAAEVLAKEFRPESGRNRSGGRPVAKGFRADRLRAIGVPRTTIQEAQTHAETADTYPFMQSWKQYEVIEAHEVLDQIPEAERPQVVALINQPAIPPKSAIAIVRNMAAKESPERSRIYSLAESSDSRDRSAALTEAAAVPAMPDPRLSLLDDARAALRKAARMFPDDPANPALVGVLDCLKSAYTAIKDARRG